MARREGALFSYINQVDRESTARWVQTNCGREGGWPTGSAAGVTLGPPKSGGVVGMPFLVGKQLGCPDHLLLCLG